jgi:hypothetical protein
MTMPPPHSDSSPLYTPAEVAEIFRRSTRTIRTWSLEGRLTRVKIGSATYYRRAEVDALLFGDASENDALSDD